MMVAWFSGGVSSAVACLLALEGVDRIVYIDVPDQHPDTVRFLRDCERWYGREIEVIRSAEYSGVRDVIRRTRYVNGPGGARCTTELKKRVRQRWERENLDGGPVEYVWGYDAGEAKRAERLKRSVPEVVHVFPLIDAGMGKAECHALIAGAGIRRPEMYDLGYPNNNCVWCVKGGMGYWNKIRTDFPEVFAEMAALEREIGRSCIRGVFLDELEPGRGRCASVALPDCGSSSGRDESKAGDGE